MKEQEFGGREVGRGWVRTETCGKGSRAAGLAETQVDGFDQGNGNSLSCEVHHGRMRALHGIRLEFSKALEHGVSMLAQLAVSRDNKGVKGLTPGLTNGRTFCQLGLLNAGQN